MKKTLFFALVITLVLVLTACSSDSLDYENRTGNDELTVNESQNGDADTEQPLENTTVTFTLTAGEAGEYGRTITYNEGTEFEDTFYAYYVPAGTYTVTNKGKYMSQINVYSDDKVTTEEGWEEPATVGAVKLLDVGKSETITVENGQHIEIDEPSVFEFTQQ